MESPSRSPIANDVVVFVCAVSAGVHGALAPEHFADGVATGLGFACATTVLALLTFVLARDTTNRPALAAATAVLAGLLVAYVFAVTTGVPLLQPEREPVELVAVATKVVELAGLLAAVALLLAPSESDGASPPRRVPLALAAVVAITSAYLALELSTAHGAHGDHHGLAPAGLAALPPRTGGR